MKEIRFTIVLMLLLFCSYNLHAQKLPDLIPFKEKALYGYCDSNLNVIIKAQYDRVYPFVEDRAIVVVDGMKGFIDRKGKQIVPCMYTYAVPYDKGYAQVGKSRHEAKFIDKNGQFVEGLNMSPEPEIVDLASERNRVGPVKEGRYFYRGRNNTEGYMTVDGDAISSSEFKYPYYSECYSTTDNYDQKFQHFYESRAIVSGANGQGYIDLNGELVIDTLYDVAFNFKEGRAKVKLNGKYGFIDKEGNVIGEIKYDQACYFYDGMAQVVVGDKCGYINLRGEEVVPIIYDYWQGETYTAFKNGLVRVRVNEKFGVIDRNGVSITDIKYDDIKPFMNGQAIVLLNDRAGVIDEKGNEIIPITHYSLNWLDKFAFVSSGPLHTREYSLINSEGKVLISKSNNRPSKDKELGPGLYKVLSSKDGYYYIDRYGTKYLKD